MHQADSVWKLSASLISADKLTEKALVVRGLRRFVVNSKLTMQYVNTNTSGALSVA